MIDTPSESCNQHMSELLKSVRHVESNFVADPVQPRECVMKEGSTKNLIVCDDKNSCESLCVMADEDDANPYEIEKRIKEAICGDVYTGFQLAKSAGDNKYRRKEFVVIKVISLQKVAKQKKNKSMYEDPIKELSILQIFDESCSNVCNQVDCIRDETHIYSIMKHYGDELFNYAGKLSEDQCRDYFCQIITGIKTLQKKNICHRDLSLENILLSPDGVCTIIDFGMSLIYPTVQSVIDQCPQLTGQQIEATKVCTVDEKKPVLMPPQGTCGKKNYIAPEVLTNLDPFNGAMVDNWALGVILFMLLTGRPPFHRASITDRWYRMIQQGKLREMLSLWKVGGLSDGAVDLLQKMLAGRRHDSRMSTDELLAHPWLEVGPFSADDSRRGDTV